MPKKIKKELMTKSETANCVLSVISMIAAIIFGGVIIWLIKELDVDISAWKCYIVFGSYLLFLAMTAAHCLQGISAFKKKENYGILFSSIISGAAAAAALINLQFAITLLLSAMGKESAAEKIIGSRTYDEFVALQRTPWILLIAGIIAAVVIGFFGIAKLSENNKNKR